MVSMKRTDCIQNGENEMTALYSVIKFKIIELIKSGKYQANDQLPTESEFCEQYDVSRTTVRLALQQLELEDILKEFKEKGHLYRRPKYKRRFRIRLRALQNK